MSFECCLEFRATTLFLLSLHPSSELFFGRVNRWIVGGEQAEAVEVGMRVVVIRRWCGLTLPLVGARERTASRCLPCGLSLLRLGVVVRTVEELFQSIGRQFLAHPRTIQHTAAVVVDEGCSIDASCFRVAENDVHSLSLQATLEVLCVG